MIRSLRFIKAIYYLILLRIVTSVGSLMDLFFGIFPIPRAQSTFNFTNLLLVITSVLGFFIIRYFDPQKLRQLLYILALGLIMHHLILLMFPTLFAARMIASVIALVTCLMAFYLAHQVRRSFKSP